ncbi:IcmT/TraK family protein [Leptospirillum ferriphilum]|uniref:IcmT/TraK family protein n=1 Tax=Leptospirillum ferriphilum TaxID=178606 RepID=UPI0006B2379A|nr:IcmT/TraK family protein [Leptospirillum ferriphilum]
MWRNTAKPARLGLGFVKPDARLSFFLLIFAFHMREWTAILAGVAILVFWGIEKMGFRLEASFLLLRSWFGGRERASTRSLVPKLWYFF